MTFNFGTMAVLTESNWTGAVTVVPSDPSGESPRRRKIEPTLKSEINSVCVRIELFKP